MSKQKESHKYLITLYARVDEYLGDDNADPDQLPDIVVSFCIVIERLLMVVVAPEKVVEAVVDILAVLDILPVKEKLSERSIQFW